MKTDLHRATATDDWVERFMRLVAQLHVDNGDHPAQSNKTPSCRLKLAILDTGIDINHPEFFGDERVKACKAWTSTSADEDSSGHGTHIASTILSLTRNVDVYVAKVTENNFLEHPDNVADVGGSDIMLPQSYPSNPSHTVLYSVSGLSYALNTGNQLRLSGVESRYYLLFLWLPSGDPIDPRGDRQSRIS